jgi:hypothetical protein
MRYHIVRSQLISGRVFMMFMSICNVSFRLNVVCTDDKKSYNTMYKIKKRKPGERDEVES